MKRWQIVYALPLEVWVEIFGFPWISREEFGRLVDRIGNFKFTEHAQFFLHEWGKHKLGRLSIDKEGLCKYVHREPIRLEYPLTAMPENIKSFDYIGIKHFDANTLDFLTKITPLLTDVGIGLGGNISSLENLRTILAIISPMMAIQSVYCADEITLPVVRQFLQCKEFAKLRKLEINVLYDSEPGLFAEMEQQKNVTFIMNWITQANTDGPRLFEVYSHKNFSEVLFKAVRKQFNAAKISRTFAVNLNCSISFAEFELDEFHVKNGIGEELDGIWKEVASKLLKGRTEDAFQITRHGADRKTEEAREWIEATTKGRDDRKIWILDPTVGRIDAASQKVLPPVDGKREDQQKPCSSKDA